MAFDDIDSIGILFPGQGAQAVGMGKQLVDSHRSARELFEQASDVLGYDLQKLCHEGPAEKLNATEFGQPALFVVGMAAATVYREEFPDRAAKIKVAAGLSLGEYTAVCFAGGLKFADALSLVKQRGEAMQAAADAEPSGMASVLGLELEQVQAVCDAARGEGEVLQPANLLCPGNIAVSGHTTALERMAPLALAAGAMKCVPLTVAGAFHTPLMQSAVSKLQQALDGIVMTDTSIPVYSNVGGRPHQSADEIRSLLSRQVVEQVQWEKSLRNMIDAGVEGFLEAAPGKVLRGTLKRISRRFPNDGFGD